jgi:hypothetical protein
MRPGGFNVGSIGGVWFMRNVSVRCMVIILLGTTLLAGGPALAQPETPISLPPALAEWKDWVLEGQDNRRCPFNYDDGLVARCAWPSRLNLEIGSRTGSFSQSWRVFAPTWASLPGGSGVWPEDVLVNGRPIPVVSRDGAPAIRLAAGDYRVDGRFSWLEMPEMIRVPPDIGLLALSINGVPVDFPVLDVSGRLWLQKRVRAETLEDRLDVKTFRLLTDDIPMRATNLIRLEVSGQSREATLTGVLLPESIPMSIDSDLPVRLGRGGDLNIQLRPGRWRVIVKSRFDGPVDRLGPIPEGRDREVWAFQPQNHLRLVKIEGIPSVDPAQTDTPADWKGYSTYVVEAGDTMEINVLRRGDPDPAPDRLNLRRTWWLDFDGRGVTIKDEVYGTLSRQWRLDMNPPAVLGRVGANGQDLLITRLDAVGKPGVELRRGQLRLTADSRIDRVGGRIPAVSWDHDFQSVDGVLNLPPGWSLFSASGVDDLPGTFIRIWTLLDLFLVLIIAMAVFRLVGLGWGGLALVTLVLTYHEPDAPRLVWISLLAAMALVRVLPEGWAKKLAGFWLLISIVILLVLVIPFMVSQVRQGLYPQLEYPIHEGYLGDIRPPESEGRTAGVVQQDIDGFDNQSARDSYGPTKRNARSNDEYLEKKKALLAQDPAALIQTGPGLPDWKWSSFTLKWNGPVERKQDVHLWLISPAVNLVLSLLRVILLAVLVYGLIDFRRWWDRIDRRKTAGTAAGLAMAIILSVSTQATAAELSTDDYFMENSNNINIEQQVNQNVQPVPVVQPVINMPEQGSACYPPPYLLEKLKGRLLKKPDCLPYCAHFSGLDINLGPESLTMTLKLHALAPTAVPLPGGLDAWSPRSVFIDGQAADVLYRDKDGTLWMLAPQGVHTVILTGPTPPTLRIQVPLPLKPSKVTLSGDGWTVLGVGPDGRPEAGLQLERVKKDGQTFDTGDSTMLPPFLEVERVVLLGLNWQVTTTVRRLTPTGAPIVVAVPLLEGESVTTAGLQVENRRVLVNMDSRTSEIRWDGYLEISPEIHLSAPVNLPIVETWILDAGPVWHCSLSGIPVIHHQDEAGQWRPEWRPWPGENVTIHVTRPEGIPGQTVTIDRARLEYTPGKRFNKADLTLNIRSSQGGQHRVGLPEGARLQVVKINGQSQPIDAEGSIVLIPLTPGSQEIFIEWHDPSESSMRITGPEVTIGEFAVNADVVFHMPRNRWILWTGGPRLGPAVLFWTYLAVVVLAALGLGRLGWTPLKTWQWLLLGLGLTQVHTLLALVIVAWLLVLDLRSRRTPTKDWLGFDLAQIGLAVWTVVALIGLYLAVEKGLLGIPLMQIEGNSSLDFHLHWTQDRIGSNMPRPWVFSLHLHVYHILMLLWALWLAASLVKWLKWGWQACNQGGLWKMPRRKRGKSKAPEDEFLLE